MSKTQVEDYGHPEWLDGVTARYAVSKGKPYPLNETLAYVFDPKDAAEFAASGEALRLLRRLVNLEKVHGAALVPFLDEVKRFLSDHAATVRKLKKAAK